MKQETGIAHIILIGIVGLVVALIFVYRSQLENTATKNSFSELTLQATDAVSGYTDYKIPNTVLKVRIPSTFIETTDRTAGLQAHISPALNLIKLKGTNATQNSGKEVEYIFADVAERITIYVEETTLTPTEWLINNVTFQGQPFSIEAGKAIKNVQISGREVAITYTSCCGGYTPTYIFEDKNTQGKRILIIFTTNSILWSKDIKEDGNYLLDYLMAQVTNTTL